MKTINNLLKELKACQSAIDWAKDKTWEEIYSSCHRGDWLLWLFNKINPNDLQKLTLAKGYCANTVRHLMKDERSIKAIDAAILFGLGKISLEELDIYKVTAYAADYAAAYVAANATAYAAAKKENQQQTADICRQYLPIEIWNIKYDNL